MNQLGHKIYSIFKRLHYKRIQNSIKLRQVRFLIKTHLTGRLPLFSGEFGYEIMLNVPYANFLNKHGLLKQTCGLPGTEALYYFSPNHLIKEGNRFFEYYTGWNPEPYGQFLFLEWLPPDFKTHFKNSDFIFEKPLWIIHNKSYIMEHGSSIVNYLDLPTLKILLSEIRKNYQIVYIRLSPESVPNFAQIQDDQVDMPLYDFQMIRTEFPDIILLQDLIEKYPHLSLNELQFKLHANCERFISVQGGNSILASYFGGKNFIFAKKGGELLNNTFLEVYPRISGCQIKVFDQYANLIDDIKAEVSKSA